MNIVNPQIANQMIAKDGEIVRCQVIDLGGFTMNAGTITKDVAIGEAVPTAAKTIAVSFQGNDTFFEVVGFAGMTQNAPGKLWVGTIGYSPSVPKITLAFREAGGAGLDTAIVFSTAKLFIWYLP